MAARTTSRATTTDTATASAVVTTNLQQMFKNAPRSPNVNSEEE